ncbi:DUF2996 domain-containing protein [Synechococcales cyanobacterium C]|uniref:DUF2996 domain-containing protein n=1 Tax=Petrachloros mirabilis ULC683 TaxID=2781853 RepID=A0A8K2A121_9CYAN|nr:DUF2996 domain-containing protein [Petrachloros mirabilis]NCJ07658.1 DUF2996 domain-containing protein [Petrachloros mirabilis ULC683]
MSEETSPKTEDKTQEAVESPKGKPEAKPEAKAKPAPKAPKPPAIEEKPFSEFVEQHYLPELKKALTAKKIEDLSLQFANNQISGQWQKGQRQFTIYFPQSDITGQRAFTCSSGTSTSDIEPFLGDERKITLDLLVFGVVQRLNAQKWLGNN